MKEIMHSLSGYEKHSGREVLLEISILAEKLSGKSVLFVCTSIKELPESSVKIVGLLNGLGINAVITDTPDPSADFIFMFSSSQAGLAKNKDKGSARWLWAGERFEEVRSLLSNYEAALLSSPVLAQNLPVPQYLIPTGIDPLDLRNREPSTQEINAVKKKFRIDSRKPLLAMVSTAQPIKDMAGVKRTHELINKKCDCQLIALGKGDISDLEVNVIQRLAFASLQQSYKGGSSVQVAEALWKGRPVVLSAASGSPFQIVHNVSGLLVHSVEGAAYQVRYLLNNRQKANELGEGGRKYVRDNFLITSALRAYLLSIVAVTHPDWKFIEL